MTNWWVNQGQSYDAQRRGGYIWAPVESHGTRLGHWETMTQVRVGDVVIHYAKGVRAISTVTAAALDTLRPNELPAAWPSDGRLVRCSYRDAGQPVALEEIPADWRSAAPGGPLARNGKVNQGYLLPLSEAFATGFMRQLGARFDAARAVTTLPAEAMETATDLLRRLIGVPISTIDGSPNLVLGVTPPDVIVATTRSPQGTPVPIADVQQALDRLRTEGAVTIAPGEVGYRSAFVGAVLLTLPGARASGTPPVVQVNPSAVDDGAGITFEGDLNRPRGTEERAEQASLRKQLFGTAQRAQCAICGEEFPVAFLRAAHIKRRSACSEPKQRDLANIAMPACVFGCDSLYELGFVAIGASGNIEVAATYLDDPALGPRLRVLAGRRCGTATSGRRPYYDRHRANVFRSPALGQDDGGAR